MDNRFRAIDVAHEYKDTVLSFSSSTSSMFKVGEFVSAAKDSFLLRGLEELSGKLGSRGGIPRPRGDDWLNQGLDCEILQPSKGWQKGKVRIRISIEFCPDEPEVTEVPESNELENGQSKSLLDDVRQIVKDT